MTTSEKVKFKVGKIYKGHSFIYHDYNQPIKILKISGKTITFEYPTLKNGVKIETAIETAKLLDFPPDTIKHEFFRWGSWLFAATESIK